jgi:hypothetical protein
MKEVNKEIFVVYRCKHPNHPYETFQKYKLRVCGDFREKTK